MSATLLVQAFDERLQEIVAYLDLLKALEAQVRKGPPRIGPRGPTITAQQQRILYSGVYLQLYNLVESTITRCIASVADAARSGCVPRDLTASLRREWVRFVAQTHEDMAYDKRLDLAFELCEHLVRSLPVTEFTIEKGGGGNWDDTTIEKMTARLGLTLRVPKRVRTGVKKHVRNEMGALKLIRTYRNSLAHGGQSFAECSEGVSARELRTLTNRTAAYLRSVTSQFDAYIGRREYLIPAERVDTGAS